MLSFLCLSPNLVMRCIIIYICSNGTLFSDTGAFDCTQIFPLYNVPSTPFRLSHFISFACKEQQGVVKYSWEITPRKTHAHRFVCIWQIALYY